MDDSLFSTRQLASFRFWPEGRIGSLFYIASRHGSINIVRFPLLFKCLDICKFNISINIVGEPIISGFGALLFRQMMTDKHYLAEPLDQLWEQYLEKTQLRVFPWEFAPLQRVLTEAEYICSWQKNAFPKTSTYISLDTAVYLYWRLCLQKNVAKWLDQIPVLMWNIHPRFVNPDLSLVYNISDDNTHLRKERTLDTMTSNHDDDVLPIDHFINFFAARYVCKFFTEHSEEYFLQEEILLDRFGRKEATLTLPEIPFELDGIDIQRLFESYLEPTRKVVYDVLKSNIGFATLPDNRKQEMITDHICRLISEQKCKISVLYQVLSDSQKKVLDSLMMGLLTYLHKTPVTIPTQSLEKESEDILPPQNDYVALTKWLKNQKELGHDYYADAGNNRSEMCRNLKKIIGWLPNENSLRKRTSPLRK